MHHKIHASQVVGGRIELLSIVFDRCSRWQLLAYGQQQRTGPHSRVIELEKGILLRCPLGNDLRQDLADLMGCIEFSALLARAGGKLADEIFIDFTKNVLAIFALILHPIHKLHNIVQRFCPFIGGASQTGIPQIDVIENALEILHCLGIELRIRIEMIE